MCTIDRLLNNIAKVKPREAVNEALFQSSDALIAAQKDQLLHGQDSSGNKLGKYKDPKYRKKKFNMNVLAGYGNYDFKLTGEFYRGIKLYFFSSEFIFKSTDHKTKHLEGIAKGDIWGLMPKRQREISTTNVAPIATKIIIGQILK